MFSVNGGASYYTYAAGGDRVRKDTGSNFTEYQYLNGRVIAEKNQNGAWVDYIYANGQMIARATSSNTADTVYFHTDHLGSARLLTSSSGAVLTSDTFYPYGQEPGGTAGPNHFQYAGLERDPDTGLDHATFRQYSATTGRWMSPDPYDGSMDLGNPQSLNRYNYAANNPLSFTDPSGQDPCSGAATFGFAVGGAPGEAVGIGVCIGEIAYAVAKDIEDILGFFNHPQFHGSTKARPNQPWGDHHIPYNGNLANILGLPDNSCEFGACGGGSSFVNGGVHNCVDLFGSPCRQQLWQIDWAKVGCFVTGFAGSLIDFGPNSPPSTSDVLRTARTGLEVATPRLVTILRGTLAGSKVAETIPPVAVGLGAAQVGLAVYDGVTSVRDCGKK